MSVPSVEGLLTLAATHPEQAEELALAVSPETGEALRSLLWWLAEEHDSTAALVGWLAMSRRRTLTPDEKQAHAVTRETAYEALAQRSAARERLRVALESP